MAGLSGVKVERVRLFHKLVTEDTEVWNSADTCLSGQPKEDSTKERVLTSGPAKF